MVIHGLAKTTLLDYPEHVAATIFFGGCNFRCPFCHNADLVIDRTNTRSFSEDEILSYLKKRKGLIDGICVTGGEPMLAKDLSEFLYKVREIGISIKLDTNGFFPAKLKSIIDDNLCDYVAMDIKNTFEKYPSTVGIPSINVTPFIESIELLKTSKIDHEFRTTVCRPFHSAEDLSEIAKYLGPNEKYFLQSFVDSGNLIGKGVSGYSPNEMKQMLTEVRKFVPNADIRGI